MTQAPAGHFGTLSSGYTSTAEGVSVVVPCYNAESHIRTTVDSLLAQSYVPDEIILVDDGSKDRTADIGSSYGGIVKVVRQPNSGAALARYKGVISASQPIVVFIDAGDNAAPEKVECYREALRRHPDCVLAFGVTWNTAKDRPDYSPFTSGPLDGSFTVLDDPFNFMLGHFWPITGVMDVAVRRTVALDSMNISRFYRVANDYAAQIKTAQFGPFVHVAHITSEFVFLPKGLTQSHGLPLQKAYALCGAVDAYELAPARGDKSVLQARVNGDVHNSLLTAYLRKNWPLARRLCRILLRYGTAPYSPRRFWWALKNADAEKQLGSSTILQLLVTGIQKISRQRQ